jgi:hypothetical protein
VNEKAPSLADLEAVLDLAVDLEIAAHQTFVRNAAALVDTNARALTASIMGVEAQHVAILRLLKALLGAGHPEVLTVPLDPAALPAAAGSVGLLDSFARTDRARPADEGAVR